MKQKEYLKRGGRREPEDQDGRKEFFRRGSGRRPCLPGIGSRICESARTTGTEACGYIGQIIA